jgi:hypothetical protein
MNNSGEAIQKILQFYKISPENCWVIFDELDLPLGNIKIRKNGGPGTHNGMKSIVGKIGRDFPRFVLALKAGDKPLPTFRTPILLSLVHSSIPKKQSWQKFGKKCRFNRGGLAIWS